MTQHIAEGDYQMRHRPAPPEYGAPLHNLVGDGEEGSVYPDDIYTHPHHYVLTHEPYERRAMNIAQQVRGKPDAMVKIYRALPKEHAHEGIHPGDWVGIDHEYAQMHGMQDDPKDDWPVISATVPAKHLYTSGDSISEWGYHGPETVGATSKTAGLNGDVPEGLTLRHTEDKDEHNITAHLPGHDRPVGTLTWTKKSYDADEHPYMENSDDLYVGDVTNIDVHPDYRRRGIANAMWEHAKSLGTEGPYHSSMKSPDGEAWAGQAKEASLSQGLPNPYHADDEFHHTWFHGTQYQGGDALDSRNRYSDEDFAAKGKPTGGPQTNKLLGTHFTALRSVAKGFAKDYSDSDVYHARLKMKNPAYFADEHALDRHIFRHAMEHHPEFAHDEDFNSSQRWNGSATPRTLAERDRQMGDDPGDPYKRWSLDSAMGSSMQWHPKQREFAKSFVDHLKSQGHDGIVYGNIVEGPKFHHSAIAFGPEDIDVQHIAHLPESPKGGDPEHSWRRTESPERTSDNALDESEERLGDIQAQHHGSRQRFDYENASNTNLDHGPWTPYNGKHVLTPYQAALGDLTDEQREAFADHVAQYHPGLDASNPMIDWLHKSDHHLAGDRTMGPRRGQPSLLEDDHPHPASIDPYRSSWQREAMGANGPDYDNLTFDDLESFGWPHTEGHRLLRAHHPEHGMVGALYYDDKPNYLQIGRMTTYDEHRRRGVATQMMRELEARYPGKPIQHGMRSDDGHAWAQSAYGTPIPENLREKQNWTVNGHEAGLHGELPEDLQFRYQNIEGKHFIVGHIPHPDVPGDRKTIGHLSMDGGFEDSEHPVSGVRVDPSYRRRGVAGAMWSAAQGMGFRPAHTPEEQTEDGHAWADKVAAIRQVDSEKSDGDVEGGIMIAVVPPEDLAARLAVEDGEDPSQLHITLAYLGRTPEYSRDQLDHLPEMVAAWAEANEPLTATVQGAGTFVKAEEDGQHVLWASVDAPGLERLHVSLVDFLASRGYSPRGDHVFIPHMTLAYGRHHFRFMPKIERESWRVNEVWICVAGRWESVTLGAGGTDEHRHAAARTDAGRRRRGGDPAPDSQPGGPDPVGDAQGAARPLSLHPRVEKDLRALHPQDQRAIRDTLDRLAAGDPSLDTHALNLKLKGWYATKASRGHRIIHQSDGQGGIYVGYVGLHDYDKAINRLTSSLEQVFALT